MRSLRPRRTFWAASLPSSSALSASITPGAGTADQLDQGGGVRDRPVQPEPAEPASGERVVDLGAQRLVAELVAVLEIQRPQQRIHRTEGWPSRTENTARHGATNRSSSKNASIRTSSSGSRRAGSGSNASQMSSWASVSRSTAYLQQQKLQRCHSITDPHPDTNISAGQSTYDSRLLQGQVARLGGAEGVGGGQAGGPDRRVQPGQRTKAQRGADPTGHSRGGNHHLPALARGVAGGDQRPQGDPAGTAQQGQQQRLDHELGAHVPSGRAQRAPQADLAAALQHPDDHHVGDPDPADQQRDRAKAQQQRVQRALGGGLGGQRV